MPNRGIEGEPTHMSTKIVGFGSENVTHMQVEAVAPSGRSTHIDGELAISIAKMQQTPKPTE